MGRNGPKDFSFVLRHCVRECMPVNVSNKCILLFPSFWPIAKVQWRLTKNTYIAGENSWELIGMSLHFCYRTEEEVNLQEHWPACIPAQKGVQYQTLVYCAGVKCILVFSDYMECIFTSVGSLNLIYKHLNIGNFISKPNLPIYTVKPL